MGLGLHKVKSAGRCLIRPRQRDATGDLKHQYKGNFNFAFQHVDIYMVSVLMLSIFDCSTKKVLVWVRRGRLE